MAWLPVFTKRKGKIAWTKHAPAAVSILPPNQEALSK